ncbi:MAG: signal peptidase I [Thermoproteales archaeon]|nr:signal peptidase I [Thermoproteales archaeon]
MDKKKMLNIITIILLILTAAIALNINQILRTPLKTEVPLAVVSSWSMEPIFHVGDMIIVQGCKKYNIGDIIVYQDHFIKTKLIVHRVIKVKNDAYITKGDANYSPDVHPVKKNQIKGKVILVIPYLGTIKLLFERIYYALKR